MNQPTFAFVIKDYHIFHSVNRWLPKTQGWITDQMALFEMEKQTVLADTLLENYPKQPISFKKPNGLLKKLNSNFRAKRIQNSRSDKRILFSHFGNRAWHDLNVPCDRRIVRFYGYDLHRLPFENQIWYERYQELFEKAEVVITEGPFMKSELISKGCVASKIKVLPFGVKSLESPFIRSIRDSTNILIAGAFKEKKGIDTALLACKEFIKTQPNKRLQIHVVGDKINSTAQDATYNHQLEKLFNDDILKPNIVRHGFVSRQVLGDIAQLCDFGLMPSQWAADRDCEGGFPVTFLELMATGLPIISTFHCDIPFAVNERNGILCNERDYSAMAKAIEKMLEPSILESKSKAAIKTVEESFDWQKLKPLYKQVILGD
ncbi:MAG: glycosyltransferase [Bacteroidia bacterium]